MPQEHSIRRTAIRVLVQTRADKGMGFLRVIGLGKGGGFTMNDGLCKG